ncbi:hypothetical protein TIFTF001_033853 [Ficus carica]|uniref:Retrotransposon gag domain-containing protein n=1 Tax=Ficus carica TaxID=3494 RepID=A0AA88DZC1_FICCA|nr:hypothetical protein TIFTF001_033853 [Ficus carica]
MISERFPISYHASPRIHFKLLQTTKIRWYADEDVQFEDMVTAECKPKMRVEVPIDPSAAQPVQDKGVQAATNPEPLYMRFKKMKPKEFNGSTDPLVAQGWLKSIELALNFMGLTENEKVMCASYYLMDDARIWWEGIELRNLSVIEATTRFNQLARLYPHMVPNEEERLRRMIRMLRHEIAVIVDSGSAPPTTTAGCVKCALCAEYHLNKQKESQPRQSEVPKNNNNNQNHGNFGNRGKSQGIQ